MLQACETDVTFVLKLILQTQGEYVVFPVLFISLYEIALFIEVELVIGLHADMLVETVQSADAECALGEVGLGGQAVFNADLIPFQLGVGIINVVFQDGRERSGSDVVHQIEKVADETVDAIIVANNNDINKSLINFFVIIFSILAFLIIINKLHKICKIFFH